MPTLTESVGIFDLTFDNTFRGILLTPATPSVPGCRLPGLYVTWESPTGWAYWLFEGPMEVGKLVTSLGRMRRAGLTTSTRKEGAKLVTARTANLTLEQVEAVSTIYEADKVFVLAPDAAGTFHAVPADIADGTFPISNTKNFTHNLQIQLTFPARRSALG